MVIYELPFQQSILNTLKCKTTFNVVRSKALNLYTQSYSVGVSRIKEYSLTYGKLLDDDPEHFFPNVVDVENLFSTQETDTFISWVPPTESVKHSTLETGTIKGSAASKTLTGTGTSFTSLTIGDFIFTSLTEIINVVTLEESTIDIFVGVIDSIESDTSLTLRTLSFDFTGNSFKSVPPMLFYIPTSWTKERNSTYVAGEKIFYTSLTFTLKLVY